MSPWDLDIVFGYNWTGKEPYYVAQDERVSEHVLYHDSTVALDSLYSRILTNNTNNFKGIAKETYFERRETIFSEDSLLNLLSYYQEQLLEDGARQRDLERWPDTAHVDDMDYIKWFINERLHVLDRYFGGFPDVD